MQGNALVQMYLRLGNAKKMQAIRAANPQQGGQ
jgi:hypothetical protein